MESLNELVGLAQAILNTGFDLQSFISWRELAFLCLLGMLGPLHFYTQSFARLTKGPDERSLLVGEGLLVAAREAIINAEKGLAAPSRVAMQSSNSRYSPWVIRPKKWLPLARLQAKRST